MGTALDVLLVEDSDTDAKLVVQALVRSGFAPRWVRVESEAELRTALEHKRFQLVVSDSSMPGFDVLRALAATKAAAPRVPFIVVSGTMTEGVAVEALRGGAADYVTKDHLERLGPAVLRELSSKSGAQGRVARELEEHVGQNLAAIKRALESLGELRGSARTKAISSAIALAKDAIDHTRAISIELATTMGHGEAAIADTPPAAVLTPRQREILGLLALGHSTKEIARRLRISAKTVDTHRAHMIDRLGVRHVAGLVHYAIREGLLAREHSK